MMVAVPILVNNDFPSKTPTVLSKSTVIETKI